MVKFYSTTFAYDYSFPAVSLAYFLRYPNPYATHVLASDTISRSFDPESGILTTTRLHLKRSKLPSAVLKLLPRSLLGAGANGDSQAYILETSTVNVKEGWMETESRNLEWTGVLSVVEKQKYIRAAMEPWKQCSNPAARHGSNPSEEQTEVVTTVQLVSRLGQPKWRRRKAVEEATEDEGAEKQGIFRSWATAKLQRSIESIGLQRTERSQPNANHGMKVVLERLRQGGLVAVLEGMRRDREKVLQALEGND